MCGIVGIAGPQETGWIERMNAIQIHRGPDDDGVFRDPKSEISLAMRRLAILDIAGGQQPMASEGGRHVLVFNGEIYNAPDLRAEMEAKGERFATDHSDTELLLRLLMREGRGALPRLNGMFAFAFYDLAAGEILCARDRFGIKPFYYTAQAGRFAFASELKSLTALPWVGREIDRQSLFHYLSLMYVPGEDTIFSGVHRLAPGSLLVWRVADRTLSVECWWKRTPTADNSTPAGEWPTRIRDVFEDAVKRWSLSDVPIACSLSGGLDSSAIVGALARQGVPVKTFSVGFTGKGEANWNELPLARAVAQKWGTDHTELVLDPAALLDDLPRMAWHLDEPYGGGLPSWLVFKAMAGSVKVGLTGTGGDELFGNYGKWSHLEDRPRWPWSRTALDAFTPDADRFRRDFFERYYYFPDAEKRAIIEGGGENIRDTSGFLFDCFNEGHGNGGGARDRVARTDLATQLPEEFLMMTDRFSMAHSLEVRTPFLDNELTDLVLSVPARLRTDPKDLKGLLRRAIAPLLPPKLRRAPKKGFVIPLTRWLRGPLRPMCEDMLAPTRLRAQGLISDDFRDRYLRPHLDGTTDYTNRVWAMLMFQLWHNAFVED
jgi:asparagine synthase (glutamine-hydrolysing)